VRIKLLDSQLSRLIERTGLGVAAVILINADERISRSKDDANTAPLALVK